MPPINFGPSAVSKMYLGGTQLTKVYLGVASLLASLTTVNERFVFEGDSITAGSNGPQYSFFVQCQTNGQYYFPVGWNKATGGETAQQMATQVAAITALTPGVVCLLAGTNDLSGTARTPAQIAADIQTCVSAYIAGGAKQVILVKVLPRNGGSSLTAPREADRLALNALIGAMASSTVTVVDVESTFNPTTDCLDGLHPNWLGAKRIGDAVAVAANSLYSSNAQALMYLDAGNICGPTAITGTTGSKSGAGVTGSVATGWTVEENGGMTVLCSKLVDTDGVEKQRIQVSGTNSTNGAIVRFRKLFAANVSTAEVVDCLTEISVNGLIGARVLTVGASTAQTSNQSTSSLLGNDFVLNKAVVRPAQAANGAAITSIYYSVALLFSAGTVAADLTIGKPYTKVLTSV